MEWNPATWIADLRQYLNEVRSEFRKVTWPSQKEYTGGTVGVIVVVAVITVVLSIADFTLSQLTRIVLP